LEVEAPLSYDHTFWKVCYGIVYTWGNGWNLKYDPAILIFVESMLWESAYLSVDMDITYRNMFHEGLSWDSVYKFMNSAIRSSLEIDVRPSYTHTF